MSKPFNLGIDFENDTTYVADQDIYHFYPEDGHDTTIDFRSGAPVVKTAIYMRDKKNITLDFKGATLFMHGRYQPVFLERCESITLRNVVFQQDRAFFTEATVLEVGRGFFRVKLNPHHPCRVEDGKLIPYSEFWENHKLDSYAMFLQAFDGVTREGIGVTLCLIGKTVYPDPKFPFHIAHLVAEQDGEDIIFRGEDFAFLRPGCTIVLGHEVRDFSNILMRECSNIHLEHYRVLNGSGMGIHPIHTRDIFLDKVQFKYDGRSEGVITNQADAIHAFSCSGRFEITDCVFEGMIDDALNIHSQFYTVEAVNGNRLTLNSRLRGETTYCTNFFDGDVIAVHRKNTTDIAARYTILKTTIVDLEHIEVELDRPAEAHESDSLVENLSAQPDITIKNCVFQHANTHLRFQSSGKIRLEDCTFTMPILLTGDATYWFEASGIRDMTVKNCRFAADKSVIRMTPEIVATADEPYYHKNITFENCEFTSTTPITANYSSNIVFRNNRQVEGKTMTIQLLNCGPVDAPGVTVERRTEEKQELSVN